MIDSCLVTHTVISDAGLITRVSFTSLPKFYTDNSSNIQKLIYY
jgi:hypothetical protein